MWNCITYVYICVYMCVREFTDGIQKMKICLLQSLAGLATSGQVELAQDLTGSALPSHSMDWFRGKFTGKPHI